MAASKSIDYQYVDINVSPTVFILSDIPVIVYFFTPLLFTENAGPLSPFKL